MGFSYIASINGKIGIHFSHAALPYLSKDPLSKPPVFY